MYPTILADAFTAQFYDHLNYKAIEKLLNNTVSRGKTVSLCSESAIKYEVVNKVEATTWYL